MRPQRNDFPSKSCNDFDGLHTAFQMEYLLKNSRLQTINRDPPEETLGWNPQVHIYFVLFLTKVSCLVHPYILKI